MPMFNCVLVFQFHVSRDKEGLVNLKSPTLSFTKTVENQVAFLRVLKNIIDNKLINNKNIKDDGGCRVPDLF